MNELDPQHIAIVMDGNGRWAQSRGLLRVEGHRAGAEAVRAVVRGCIEHQIPVLSLFAFSSENWSRPEEEVTFLMQLFMDALHSEIDELHQNGVSLRFTGDRNPLSPALQEQMRDAETLTKNNTQLILNLVVNYGGKWDLVEAAKTIAKRVTAGELNIEAIDETVFAQALSTAGLPDPDLFIRTSGEQRISNFFLWQLAYAELYFSDIHWPDFNAEEFEKALASFSQRERRYGKTSQQLSEADHV
ncbi:Ditrans,polycis-undecaprenyl-diphosphate synthase ((2E,6E)-farnesyl-diphosphate specific) [Legionella massiliensis]|uniref:Ditrans,polycis-undecaprenyl-diphosphate synthase ((2E,6E)-farnesyl-diphosphate specific) n=1 Tax=Legionella massiliensis TaxID=1034943 RepID=A0A078KUU6_9GAMM|nr:isoprenyl transferase [Legionella massiliensis]CDZ76772.1 Ditrans,polycis-undecaprenyl-diphosphate synthase ((2E,6E)-farnesyl-diphosphate specific) [Legionella massiliensis]CEE12510.1 Ditrans,polycis-undecaprenyl-diphosphate synthase ((2E,6E)-farnesyl-diphosphate specific) [Legionella massiliensis]